MKEHLTFSPPNPHTDYNMFVEEYRKNTQTTWIMKPCGMWSEIDI